MKYLFTQENAGLLAQIAWTRTLLGFDFDGTLAPIVADRNSAAMRSRTATLLRRVCALYPCAIISGRSQPDLARRVGDARPERLVSNLGFEAGQSAPRVAREVAAARNVLEAQLADLPGIDLEDKGFTLAVHYRRSRRKRDARAAILEAAATLPQSLALKDGKLTVHVVHTRAPTKANAVLRLRDELAADTVLYVGDDASDEEVFELDEPGRLISVRVGRSKESHAPYFVHDQHEVDRLLRMLIQLRDRTAGQRRPSSNARDALSSVADLGIE
jgi:trehalose 6-phosphate phosphatase